MYVLTDYTDYYACIVLPDYTACVGEALSKWIPGIRGGKMSRAEDPNESRAVFVDENKCIGCKNCVWCAPATFRMEPVSGRSRVFAQWLNTEEELDTAIMSCPVDCIHWVDRSELPALEHVCQKMQVRCPAPSSRHNRFRVS